MLIKCARKIENWGLLLLMFFSQSALASNDTGLPWETPLRTISDSLSGPVATSIATIALVVCGISLALGGEMSDFVKRLLQLAFALSILLLANSLLNNLFGVSGAVIGI